MTDSKIKKISDSENHPWTKLRRAITQSAHRHPQKSDFNRTSVHSNGDIYSYEIHEVEAALNAYEEAMPSAKPKETEALTIEEQIQVTAKNLVDTHDSMATRDFARNVLAYIAMPMSMKFQLKDIDMGDDIVMRGDDLEEDLYKDIPF